MYIKQLVLCSLMTLRKAVVLLENVIIHLYALLLVPVRCELLIFTQKSSCFVYPMPFEFNLQKKETIICSWMTLRQTVVHSTILKKSLNNLLLAPRRRELPIFTKDWRIFPFCNCMNFEFIERFYWLPQEKQIDTLSQTHKIPNGVDGFVHTPSEDGYNRGKQPSRFLHYFWSPKVIRLCEGGALSWQQS